MRQKIAYPMLGQLMGKHNIDRQTIAEIIGLSYRNVFKKLYKEQTIHGHVALFDIVEASKIAQYFRSLGEVVTIEDIFFS